jgi:UDP-N-acetylmuramyl pentapeptide phosphotransferase/UDP-N-acetylglucosamine-1-phosphate transferase
MFDSFNLLELLRLDAVSAGLVSLIVAVLLVWTKDWHGKFSMDFTDGVQKFHTAPTPRIGGVAIAIGVIIGYAASSRDPAAAEKRAILASIILAGVPAFVFGLLEDLTKRVSVTARLMATMASGALGWAITGVSIAHVAVPGLDWLLGFTVLSVMFTAFAVGGVANSINIIDGFNGLAAGAVLIMLAAFGFIARTIGDIPLAFSCLVIAGAVFGFFLVNWPSGRIFLGDGGAYFVGFALAWIAVLLPHRNPSISHWVSLLVCAYPVMEVLFSYVRRTIRVNHHPSQPDQLHMHHLVHTKIVQHLFSGTSKAQHNGLTSPFCWLFAFIPALTAILMYRNTNWIIGATAIFCFAYIMIYRRLSKFKWF